MAGDRLWLDAKVTSLVGDHNFNCRVSTISACTNFWVVQIWVHFALSDWPDLPVIVYEKQETPQSKDV